MRFFCLLFLLSISEIHAQKLTVVDLMKLYQKNRFDVAEVMADKNFKLIETDEWNAYYQNKNDNSIIHYEFEKGDYPVIFIQFFIPNRTIYDSFKNEVVNSLKGKYETTTTENLEGLSAQEYRYWINYQSSKRRIRLGELTKKYTRKFKTFYTTFEYSFIIDY